MGDSYDNALAEMINGLFKAEVIHRNPSGEVIFKVDPSRGSDNLSLGTQQMPPGAGIPRHRHTYMDEFIYILEGSGTVLLNDERLPIQKGDTIFIPKGSWHAFEKALVEIDCMGKRIPDAASRLQAPSAAFQTADAVRP